MNADVVQGAPPGPDSYGGDLVEEQFDFVPAAGALPARGWSALSPTSVPNPTPLLVQAEEEALLDYEDEAGADEMGASASAE